MPPSPPEVTLAVPGSTLEFERPSPNGGGPRTPRQVRRRRALPGGRAVVGGLLVALAAVGVFASWAASTSAPTTAYVVAARDLTVGERLTRDDLRMATIDLPTRQAAVAYADVEVLVGATVVGPLRADELVQAGDLSRSPGGAGTAHVSFAVPASDALGGHLRDGERVDLVAVFGTGGSATVETVAVDALVIEVTADDGLAGQGSVTVTVAVPPADVEKVALASTAGTLKVVRAPTERPEPAPASPTSTTVATTTTSAG